MKVLAISASPRIGGNSDILCDQFLKGAADAGHQTEKISLSKMSISPCRACYSCGKNHVCVIDDDMAVIQEKLMKADVIVLATPVYFYCMDAQLKMMIDRCLPHYLDIKNKRFWLIVTAADPARSAADATVAGLRGFLDCLPGAEERGILYGTGAWEKGEILKLPVMRQAYEEGKAIK